MASVPAASLYKIDDIELDVARGILRRGSEEIHLKPKAFQILVYLLVQRDRLVSKEELLEEFWKDTVVGEEVLANSIGEIRRAFGDSPRDSHYLRTVPKRGYRFVAAVQEISSGALVATEQITTIQVHEEYSDERPSRKYWPWIALTAVTLLVAVLVWHYWPKPSPNTIEPGIRMAIVQFENRTGRQDMDWLRAGLVDMLTTSLSASPKITLIRPHQLESILGNSTAAPIGYEDALRAARQAGARILIMGAFASVGDTVRLDSHLYDVPSGRLLGGESLTVEKPELLLTHLDTLSSKLAARLGAPILTQTKLSEVMTNNLEAYRLYSLGLARRRDMRLPEAIALYQRAVELDPEFAMAYAQIGFTYSWAWTKPDEGKPYLEKAYRLSEHLTPLDRLFIRAWYAAACNDYKGAEQAYREVVSAFPLEVEAYYELGTLLVGIGKFDDARQALERGLSIQSNMPQVHNMLSTAYLELGETEKAVESAQRYVTQSGEANAYDTLGSDYQRIGRYREARDTYLEAIRRKPDFIISIIHLGNLYFQLGQYRDALKQYGEYIRLAPSNADRARGHASAAWLYRRKGDLANAERETSEAVGLDPKEINASLLLRADRGGLILTDDLRRRILALEAQAGRGRIAYFVAGYVALRDHRAEEALQYLRTMGREPPIYWNIDPLETGLADAYLELGRIDQAIAEYQRVLKLNANYAMARYRLGLALEKKGMRREARGEFEQFLTIWKDADSDVPELIDALQRYQQESALVPLKR